MLPRTLEKEWMDSCEDALAYDRLDHSVVNRLFAEEICGFIARDSSFLAPIHVLDLGCGNGLIPIAICHLNASAQITAIDAADSMLTLAAQHVEKAGYADRIRLLQADVSTLVLPEDSFNVVCHNSLVHHLHHPRGAMQLTLRVCRTGGLVFVRDLVRPSSEAEVSALVSLYGGAEAAGAELFRASLHAALTLEEAQDLVAKVGGDPSAVRRTSDRHWTWAERKP